MGNICVSCQGKKKSLLIGINYFGQDGQLNGCINDVANVKKLIMSRGFLESTTHMRVLTDDNRNPANQPTRQNILDGMYESSILAWQTLLSDQNIHNKFICMHKCYVIPLLIMLKDFSGC